MHNNYYFLTNLSRVLHEKLIGYELTECFTQNKNELVIGFVDKTSEFFIKAHLDPSFCCLSFPTTFRRARKNSVNLFDNLFGRKITGVHQFENERCFALIFDDTQRLLFKMHGNRSNIIRYNDTEIVEVFKKSLKKDLDLDINMLERPLDQSYEDFLHHEGDYRSLFPTFGKVIKTYLHQNRLEEKNIAEKWELIQDTIEKLAHPTYYITTLEGQLLLSMLEIGSVQQEFNDPIEAIDAFFIKYITEASLKSLKNEMLTAINRQLKQSLNYVKKAEQKLAEIESRLNYRMLADILMANLHRVPAKAEKVTLENFYNDNLPVTIKLKRDLSPQNNAEGYYRKAKNQSLEIKSLKTNLTQKNKVIASLEDQKGNIEKEADLKSLRKQQKNAGPAKKVERRPYNNFHYNGFDIWVGKNARNNDEMLQQYSFKEDLWLHARESSGSHVLLKYQAGKNFPKNVIEKAAELAAYYSKRKSDSLCPVIVTPRKFVRKRKGDPAGAVIVDKEEQIILVRPGNQI